jgi:hypothetical protein
MVVGPDDPKILKAQTIIDRIHKRDLYIHMKEWLLDQNKISEFPDLKSFCEKHVFSRFPEIQSLKEKLGDDLCFQLMVRKHYSNLKNDHPIEKVCFFGKRGDEYFHKRRGDISEMIANANVEHSVTLYCKISKSQMDSDLLQEFELCQEILGQQ